MCSCVCSVQTQYRVVIILLVSNCYCFKARGIISVVCSVAHTKGIMPFTRDLIITRAAIRSVK